MVRAWATLVLMVSAQTATPTAIVMREAAVETQPLVTLEVDGSAKPLLVDTGSAIPLVLFSSTNKGKAGATVAVTLSSKDGKLADSARILGVSVRGADGIVGWPVLKGSIWKLDLPSGCHEFLKNLPAEAASWISFPISSKRESLAILHPDFGEVFLDSGARRGVCLSPKLWEAWKRRNPGAFLTLAEGLSPASPGGSFANPVAYNARFDLGPLRLARTNVGETFFDPSHDNADVLLGLEALAAITVIIDGPGNRVYANPQPQRGNYRELPANRLQTAFVPDPKLTGALYVHVLPGGHGEKAGLRTGDLVVSCNGSVRPPGFQTMHALVRQQGAKIHLRILRNRQRMEISLVVP